MNKSTAQGVRYLLGFAPEDAVAGICARLRIDPDGPVAPMALTDRQFGYDAMWLLRQAPQAIRIWMLQEDDPQVNAVLFQQGLLPAGVAADVRSGLLFGPGRFAPVPDGPVLSWRSELPRPTVAGLIDSLRGAVGSGTLRVARAAAGTLRRADWPLVVAAHQDEPFPGFARWALAEQIDCPAELRAAFGSHPRFTHRLRQAGVLGGPADHLATVTPADRMLGILGLGREAFPTRLAEAEDVLRPQVRRELGGHPEAWAVLAQLLPDFTGTLPELVDTAAAVAGTP
ncbi:hypothetical protein [Kitasatospora sp. NPDC002040]|uniref:hypothetical protein n=1 Tax=Kitasatospora sp. NPDC002040 TaxID=3154661 RepID=UPI00331ED363